jgi:ERF superfamily
MNAVVEHQPQETQSDSRSLMLLIERLATSPEVDMVRVEKLLELKERWDANEARKAFVAAMAAFKADPPTIIKDKHVEFTSERTGKKTEYDHATLGALCDAIVKGLSKHGISHRWDIAQANGRVKVTCILTHSMGHSESVSMNGPLDDSGGKNAIQAIASSTSYLERYTLFAATGLAAQEDDDGRGSSEAETISAEQVKTLTALIMERGSLEKALRFLKVKTLEEIPAKNFDAAVAMVKTVKVKEAKKEGAK